YSTGMQRKLQFLRAFVLDTPILFLDEPTASLDPISAEEIRRTILTECRARGQTVILSANNLLDVERLADRVAMIHRGRLEMIGAPSSAMETGTIRVLVRGSLATAEAALEEWTRAAGPASRGAWKAEERAGGVLLRGEATDPRQALPALLDLLWRRQITIDQVDLRPFVLEEEFLRRVDDAGPDREATSAHG
ncbi:MAG: hypothetical protein ACRECR_03405, partial [Thermoplasmata archaeon]